MTAKDCRGIHKHCSTNSSSIWNKQTLQKRFLLLSRSVSNLGARTRLGLVVRTALLAMPVLAVPLVSAASSIILTTTFDDGYPGWKEELCCEHSAQFVGTPIRGGGTGSKALKITFKKTDATRRGDVRAELRHNSLPYKSERWYAVSLLFPSNFAPTEKSFIVTQWHDFPDDGEPWKIPPLFISTKGERLNVGNRWDSVTRRITPKRGGQEGIKRQDWDIGPLPKNRWVDFVVHVKWSHESDGFLEVFKDGVKVVSKTGPNTYWDERGPFWKIGMYASDIDDEPSLYDFNEQVIYYDRIRMGDASASYKAIAPSR